MMAGGRHKPQKVGCQTLGCHVKEWTVLVDKAELSGSQYKEGHGQIQFYEANWLRQCDSNDASLRGRIGHLGNFCNGRGGK